MQKPNFDLLDISGEYDSIPPTSLHKYNDKELLFVPTAHASDFVTGDSEIFRNIKDEFDRFKPQSVVIEGQHNNAPVANLLSSVLYEIFIDSKARRIAEPFYVAYLAKKSGIPYFGGEPTPERIVELFNTPKFTYKDYIFYTYLLILAYTPNRSIENAITLAKKYYLEGHDLSGIDSIGADDFLVWYQEKQGKVFSFNTVEAAECACMYNKSKYYSQRLNSLLNINRNKELVSTIYSLFANYNKVMVVYGASHYTQISKVLEQMFSST